MRLKRQKRHRRAVRFYTACFGFRQPFKVLCDGTFIHNLSINNITPLDNALSNLLAGTVKVFTTSCVIAELKCLIDENQKKAKKTLKENDTLNDSYLESFKAARNLTIARCDHEKRIHAADCIAKIIGENNSDHFFVATQDTDLRRKFQEIPGVPLIFGLRNALLIEPPSAFQRQFVQSTEEERLHMTEREYKMLNKRVKEKLATERERDMEPSANSDENEDLGDQDFDKQAVTKTKGARNRMVVKDKAQFKRKRAKGPNPLSCLKKKSRWQPNPGAQKEGNGSEGSVRSRSRNRKRSRGGKNVA